MGDIREVFEQTSNDGLYPMYPERPLLFMDFSQYIIAGNPLAAVTDGDDLDINILRNKVTGGLEIEPYGANTVAGGGSIPIQSQFQNEGVRDLPSQFSLGFVTSQVGSLDNTTWIQNQYNDKTFLSDLFSDCPCNGDIGDYLGGNTPVTTQSGYGGIGAGNGSGNGFGSGQGIPNPFSGGGVIPQNPGTSTGSGILPP